MYAYKHGERLTPNLAKYYLQFMRQLLLHTDTSENALLPHDLK